MDRRRNTLIVLSIGLLTYTLIVGIDGCKSEKNKNGNTDSLQSFSPKFIGSTECQSCHAKEYSDWKVSDHFNAMQVVTDSTVLGDFSGVTLIADGVTNTFFKRDGKFFINTQSNDGKNHDYEISYTFGHYPLQQYLVQFQDGKLQSTRASWDSRNKKWFHQYAGDKIHHRDWLHWTGNGQNWNTMCASCHSTDLRKNYDFTSDNYKTTWSEINVSCESCHGPGSTHVQLARSEKTTGVANAGLTFGKNLANHLQLNTCAPCHARKADISATRINSNELMDNLIPQVINDEFYFADGQIKEEDYEYGSFTQSKMFHNNVKCSDCHNPHSGKLKLTGNALCMSCHEPKYDTKEHHFHAINTEASQCISCHMPTRTYMGNDIRRDHSFRIPRPDQSVVYNTPNACTSCHKNQSTAWAANAIKKWYGPERSYHFSDDLLPGSLLNNKSESYLIKLLADTLQPEIARATAAYYLGQMPTQKGATFLLYVLRDGKAMVRYYALLSLANFPNQVWIDQAHINLNDKVRSVRIAAAALYHSIPRDMIPDSARHTYQAADAENKNYIRYQTDFAVGNLMLADYEMQEGDYANAIVHYLRGLEKDSLMNYARLNLSAAYNSLNKNTEALKALTDAARIDPSNDRIFYNLGLLHYELGDVSLAKTNFKKAISLGSQNAGLYYNYGILLQQEGMLEDALEILRKGYSINPRATNINYALAFIYMRQNELEKARPHVEILRGLDPGNPTYQSMFRSFGI